MRVIWGLLAVLFALAQGFYLEVNEEPVCLNFYSNIFEQRIAFDVTSPNPEQINITIYNSQNRLLQQFTTARDTANIRTTNRFQVCFNTLDSTNKHVSFDIWEDSADKIKKLASKSDLYNLHSSIVQASNVLRTVSEQEKFQEQRENVHTEIIKDTENALKNYGVLKVCIVIATILIQIVVVNKTLKSK